MCASASVKGYNCIPILGKWWSVPASLPWLVWWHGPRRSNCCIGCGLKVPSDHVLWCCLLVLRSVSYASLARSRCPIHSCLVVLRIWCKVMTSWLVRKWSWYANSECSFRTYQINFVDRVSCPRLHCIYLSHRGGFASVALIPKWVEDVFPDQF